MTENERKEMPFKYYGSDTFKIKLADLEKFHEAYVAERKKNGMGMVIELKAVRIEKHKELRKTISFVKDPMTSIHFGVPIGLHPDKNIKWQKIILGEYNSFNLKIPDEAFRWYIVRIHPEVNGSPFQSSEILWDIYDADIEAKKETAKALKVASAINKAVKMKKEEILPFHRYLSLALPPDPTPKKIKADLLIYAQNNSADFLEKFDSNDRKMWELYHSAKNLGIISYDIEKGFTYKGTFLGNSNLEVIRFFEEQSVITTAINSAVKKTDYDQETFINE